MNVIAPLRDRTPPYAALLVVCAGVFIAADDQTVIVTVLPQVMIDLEVQTADFDHAAWAVTGYLLGYLIGMPLIGRMSDAWGRRSFYALSMIAFTLGSIFVALTQSLNWLIAARVFQAVGAGALVPITIAIVGDLFPPGRRALPLGIVGASAEAGGVIGPLWGGSIVRFLDWRWVFWINAPLAIGVVALLLLTLRPGARHPSAIDWYGGALIACFLSCSTLALSRVGDFDGWGLAYTAGAAMAALLVFSRMRSAADPLLPPAMFRAPGFSAANATHLLVGAALIIGMATVPLMANTIMQRTPLEGGLWLMRMTAGIPIGALIGGVLCQRLDLRVPALAGAVAAAAGFWLLSGWGLDIAEPSLSLHLGIVGLGFGLLIVPIALAGTETVDESLRATAASMVTAMRIMGMTFGLAALTAWGAGRFDFLVADIRLPFPSAGESAADTLARAAQFTQQINDAGLTLFHEFFLIAGALCMLTTIPALLMITGRGGAEADAAQGRAANAR